uniref:Uncharacterized protein n=1 Tax=Arundo donax TaxID=35708 RepID=A0A0A9H088_ARUDO
MYTGSFGLHDSQRIFTGFPIPMQFALFTCLVAGIRQRNFTVIL